MASANTAGGTILIGVEDGTRHVRGIADPLSLEERLASALSDGIAPHLVPDIEVLPWRSTNVLAVQVYPSRGRPHYLKVKAAGVGAGVYVRVGSTNRRADDELVAELRRTGLGKSFDEQAMPELDSEALDFRAASECFAPARKLKKADLETLRLLVPHQGRKVPSVGGVLLFGREPDVRRALPPHPFLQRLARALLGKAERAAGQGPARLPLDRKWTPELYAQADAEQLQLWLMLLDDLCSTGWVAMVLSPPRDFATFTDRNPRLELRDFEALAAWASYTPQALRWQRQWLDHLAAHWSTHGSLAPSDPQAVLDYLARSPLTLVEDLPLMEATRSLDALRALCQSGRTRPLREASAQVFQGRSKLLDNRDELLRLMGAAPGQFQEAPIQLLVALPDTPRPFGEVLFIENLVTFERMADRRSPGWAASLLVYAAGFKGSAQRLRSREGCRLYVRTPTAPTTATPACPQHVEEWLFADASWPVRFFGDLDYVGMQILVSLRHVFPHAQAWAQGYGALAEILERGGGHLPAHAGKELQLDPGQTGCSHADQYLLPLMRRHGRFMDQETFDPDTAA